VGTSRFETFLRRHLSVKGIVAPTVEPKLQAGIELLSGPGDLAENALAMGWRGFECYASINPGVGNYACFELRPAAGIVALVERVNLLASGGSVSVALGIADSRPAGSTAITDIGTVDSRYGSRASLTAAPACRPFSTANATVPGVLGYVVTQPSAADILVDGPWILTPRDLTNTFQVLCRGTNQLMIVSCRWWERVAEPSELAAR
jgi:hypothetical protein